MAEFRMLAVAYCGPDGDFQQFIQVMPDMGEDLDELDEEGDEMEDD